ncbi:MAG: cation:proton antiporter [Methanomicrobia archaeon]|jgi:multicomponent Na+:H+ antiporter subunit F|nr:cation:proton antiporter [Methanomicrobia archaeon]MCK4636293.1 cation:proton antiporter [Methanomicrobia archaeon]
MVGENILVDPLLIVSIVLIGTSLICMFRVIYGPTLIDRMIGFNTIGTKMIIFFVLLSVFYERSIFLDLAIAYSLINFLSPLILVKYLEMEA